MASAFLHSRNEPRSSDINKFSNNSKLNFTGLENITSPNPSPNPNPNPNCSHFFIGNTSRDVIWKNREQRPASAPPGVAFNGSSMNSAPVNYRYITFRLGSYTRRELKELKKRLISDLERVRTLRHWMCSTPVPKSNYHPPQMELPTAPEVALKGNERQKSAVGQKRTKPAPAIRDTKKQCGRVKNNVQRSKVVMRKCGQILAKLMKHKHGWVFNTPVDAVALKLYDYHSIITNPMDLGTIKSKLAKNEYESPLAFASDVRLTFQNAMVYNGKGSGVFLMAERLLLLFEDMFNQTPQKTVGDQAKKKQNRSGKVPVLVEKPVSDVGVALETLPVSNVTTTSNQLDPQVAVLKKSVNLGKPKPMAMEMPMVRDVNKRVMTAEEKSELAGSLLNLQLGPEGMDQIMGIIKKGVLGVEHEGDEIELDLGVLDDETLWELHSFIGSCSCKKAATSNMNTNLVSCVQANNCAGSKAVVGEEEGRKKDGGEEDIDIGEDEIAVSNFPCVEIEKDGVNGGSGSSSSCSSSSDSSSSSSGSGSGSGSSSGNSCNEEE
ncbi:hypothetical protein L6452_44230 [Arctium lappa]|uniref:Uncharacterized protein n=1 Tax=Arctium lappa TaxID=4217 RepID=A0ACB8XFB5_ARCLA|nr:hypothetical protein L6452_44230 [Arctium lappa]